MKLKKIDMSVLDELIGKCEESMVSPFKKAAVIEVEEPEKSKEEDPEADDETLQELIEMYKKIKG